MPPMSAARLKTRRVPSTAARASGSSRRSRVTFSASGWSWCHSSGGLMSAARTGTPARSRSPTRGPPMNPPAPATSTRSVIARARHLAGQLIVQGRDVRVHHQLDELLEPHPGLPAQLLLRLAGVAQEVIYLRGPVVVRIDFDVLIWVEPLAGECDLHGLPNAVCLAGRDDEVVGLIGLEHHPHRLDVVGRVAPVALRLEVAEVELLLHPGRDPCDRSGDLACHEGLAPPG